MRSRNAIGIALIAVGTGIAAYKILLTDEARHNICETGKLLAHGWQIILGTFDEMIGEETDFDRLDANRAKIREEWKRLGY